MSSPLAVDRRIWLRYRSGAGQAITVPIWPSADTHKRYRELNQRGQGFRAFSQGAENSPDEQDTIDGLQLIHGNA